MKHLPLSLEYDAFIGRPTDSLKRFFESYAFEQGASFYGYANGIRGRNRHHAAYADVVAMKGDIDGVLGSGTKVGEAFLDGGALAIDSFAVLAPELIDPIHEQIGVMRDSLRAGILGNNPAPEDYDAYVDALRHAGNDAARAYVDVFSTIMSSLAEVRGYHDPTQYLAVPEGFGFVMEAANRAHAAEHAAFEKEAVDELTKDDDHRFSQVIGRILSHVGVHVDR